MGGNDWMNRASAERLAKRWNDELRSAPAQPEQGSVDNPEAWEGIGEAYDKPTIAQPGVEAAWEIAKRLTQKLVDEGQQFKDHRDALQWPGSAAIEQAIVEGAEAFAASETATVRAENGRLQQALIMGIIHLITLTNARELNRIST